MNSVQKQYFQEISRLLTCSAKQKKHCIVELKNSVCSFLESNPDAALDDLHNEFGSPNSIAESFLECTSPKELSHRLSIKRKIIFGIIGVVAALAIVLAITGSGKAIYGVYVDGTFSYNGTTSSATSSAATAYIYDSDASYVTKAAWSSGNTAYASGTVEYLGYSESRTVSISCDKNGNLY